MSKFRTTPWAVMACIALAQSHAYAGGNTGPDLITRTNNHFNLAACRQFGRSGEIGSGTIAMGISTTACNNGDVPVHWFQMPNTDHPVMMNNFYRLTTADGYTRFEQIGQSWMKHGFGAAQFDECSLGCAEPFPDNTQLGPGCSDPYLASQMSDPCNMSPRSAIHPYTGAFEGGAWLGVGGGCTSSGWHGNFPAKNHIGHVHDDISHRLQVQETDLIPESNPTARYFGEIHYIAPHEFVAANGAQHNNASHQEFIVEHGAEPGTFNFLEPTDPVSESPALDAWVDATQVIIEPQPGVDGRAILAFDITELGGGQWHYEYAIYNMNLDQAIGALAIPVPEDVTLSAIGFHAPLHHAPELNADNYSNDPWSMSTDHQEMRWSTVPFDVDPEANALRYGTVYNFRFNANAPPKPAVAEVELFKSGPVTTMVVATLGPSSEASLCGTLEDCADPEGDGIRNDGCVWSACEDGACMGIDIVFADMGGPFGDCAPDGAADGNDRFHALNCFANKGAGGYPCAVSPPTAFNVDTGGPFGACSPDGVCDANDAFHALDAFSGTSSCACPLNGPAPQFTPRKLRTATANITLAPSRDHITADARVAVDVLLHTPLPDLRGYQLHVGTSGGHSGSLELIDITIQPAVEAARHRDVTGTYRNSLRPHVFAGLDFWKAFNTSSQQMLAGLDAPGIAVEAGYLATFVFRSSPDAAGMFVVELMHDDHDSRQRTFLIPTGPDERIALQSTSARIMVRQQ